MNDAPRSLDALRSEIDTVDDALLELLERRAILAAEIGALKNNQSSAVFRPAREAALLRRLIARTSGEFPASALARIWTEIIAVSTHLQGGLTVAYCPIGDVGTSDRLAHARFGTGVSVVSVSSPAQVIAAVSGGKASVGLLPVPRQDDADAWWTLLRNQGGTSMVQVVAQVPFVRDRETVSPTAFVIAPGAAEPSGDDNSLIGIACHEPVSRGHLQKILDDCGLAEATTITVDDPNEPGVQLHLADIAGNVAANDERLQQVLQTLPAQSTWQIGVYATPVLRD